MESLAFQITLLANDTRPCPQDDNITWTGVGIAASLIGINGIISLVLGLGLFSRLIISAIRCLVQLTAMAYILTPVLSSDRPEFIFGYSGLLVLLASFDVAYHHGRKRYTGIFVTALGSLLLSSAFTAVIGTQFTMDAHPFYEARKFIPTFGMLLGNSMSGLAIGMNSVISKLSVHGDHIEAHLAMGASRFEAGRPVAVEALRTAMLPTLNAMSVMGLISIPGMLTGQILAGADPLVAVKYQQIMMFLIAASTSLGTVIAVVVTLVLLIDRKHRLRRDRILVEEFFIYRRLSILLLRIKRRFLKIKALRSRKPPTHTPRVSLKESLLDEV